MNPNNCETCDYNSINDDPNLHCYMFKDAPTEPCAQHTGRMVNISRFGSLGMQALILAVAIGKASQSTGDSAAEQKEPGNGN